MVAEGEGEGEGLGTLVDSVVDLEAGGEGDYFGTGLEVFIRTLVVQGKKYHIVGIFHGQIFL